MSDLVFISLFEQVNACNGIGATALHDAVERGDKDIIKLLVDSGGHSCMHSLLSTHLFIIAR